MVAPSKLQEKSIVVSGLPVGHMRGVALPKDFAQWNGRGLQEVDSQMRGMTVSAVGVGGDFLRLAQNFSGRVHAVFTPCSPGFYALQDGSAPV
ncbi:MAG: hypothetical protein ILA34_02540 [Bacteroidaceae bacterium]|nr:hypothetical protein [Bacteroidaceae bacterium]